MQEFLSFLGTTAIGYFVGRWADIRFGTEPWLSTAGVVVGAASGLVETIRLLKQYGDLS